MGDAKRRWVTDALAYAALYELEDGLNMKTFVAALQSSCVSMRRLKRKEIFELAENQPECENEVCHRKRLLLICLCVKLIMAQVPNFVIHGAKPVTSMPLVEILKWVEKIRPYFNKECQHIYFITFETVKQLLFLLLKNNDKQSASVLISNYEEYFTLMDCNSFNVMIATYNEKTQVRKYGNYLLRMLIEIGQIHCSLDSNPFLYRLQDRVAHVRKEDNDKDVSEGTDEMWEKLEKYEEKLDNLKKRRFEESSSGSIGEDSSVGLQSSVESMESESTEDMIVGGDGSYVNTDGGLNGGWVNGLGTNEGESIGGHGVGVDGHEMDDDSDIVVDDGASDECRVVDDEEMDNHEVYDEEVNDQEVYDEEVNDEEVNDEEVNDEEVYDEEVNDEEVYDEEVNDQEVINDEEVYDEEVDDLGEVNDSDSDIVVDGETVNDEKCEKLVEINQVCDTLGVVDGQLRYESETSEELTIEEKGDADLRAVNEKANKNEVNESSDEWSKQEDENLMEGVEKYGLGSWNDIQDAFPLLAHKEPDACYNRWQELCKVSNHELSLQQVSTNDHGSPVYRLTRKKHIRKIFSE